MTTITREVLINASKQHVWDVLADFGNVSRTSPTISKSYLTSDETIGLGTTRHCDLTMMGAQLEERIVGWQEGELLQIDIYEWKNMPGIKAMSAEFKVQEEGSQTRLQATMNYELKWGVMGNMMDAMMMRNMNSKGWTQFMAGIKHFAETGNEITPEVKLNVQPVIAIA